MSTVMGENDLAIGYGLAVVTSSGLEAKTCVASQILTVASQRLQSALEGLASGIYRTTSQACDQP